jgi:hypothetical protein
LAVNSIRHNADNHIKYKQKRGECVRWVRFRPSTLKSLRRESAKSADRRRERFEKGAQTFDLKESWTEAAQTTARARSGEEGGRHAGPRTSARAAAD